MDIQDLGKTSTGIQANAAAFISYLGWFVTGLIFYLIEKENKFVRFHAMQSILLFGGLFALHFANTIMLGSFFHWELHRMISSLIGLLALVLWIVLMLKAYQGEYFKLPIIGDIAEKNS